MKKVKWMALTMATMVLMSGCGDKKVEEFKVTEEDSIRKRELEINPGGFEITKNNDLLVVYNTEAVFMNWDGEAKKAFDTLRGNGKKYFSWDNLSYYGWLAYYGTRFFAAGSGGIGRRLFEDT